MDYLDEIFDKHFIKLEFKFIDFEYKINKMYQDFFDKNNFIDDSNDKTKQNRIIRTDNN